MRVVTVSLIAMLAAALGACAAPQRGPPTEVIDRILAKAPGAAQPSTIVAVELAYARAAKEQGLEAAMLAYGTLDAKVHQGERPVLLQTASGEPAIAGTRVSWGPRVVVQSCDGTLALSLGRYRNAENKIGNYVTAWKRQPDGNFKWTYEVAGLDDPQPPVRSEPDVEEGDIVVTALDVIQGYIASCPRAGEVVPPPPAVPAGESGSSATQFSKDGTLRWRWEHRAGGVKYVTADHYFQGEWVPVIEETLASAQ